MYSDEPAASKHPLVPDRMRPWAEEQILHVAACYSNPRRWRTRRELATDCLDHLSGQQNVRVHLVELAFGDRPFEVADPSNPDHLCLRSPHEIWAKENLLNLAIQRFPSAWQYGAYIDLDFACTRRDWALEAVHMLQHHRWVQLFSYVQHLTGRIIPGEGHQPINLLPGFALTYAAAGRRLPADWEQRLSASHGGYRHHDAKPRFPGAPGGGWAFRREALDAVGGLLDRCICGSADSYMAFGLVGAFRGMQRGAFRGFTPSYSGYIQDWQRRAAQCHGDIGYVDQLCIHHHHGPLARRGYGERDRILAEQHYDPRVDVYPDYQGVLQLAPGKHRLRQRLQEYFRGRTEDCP